MRTGSMESQNHQRNTLHVIAGTVFVRSTHGVRHNLLIPSQTPPAQPIDTVYAYAINDAYDPLIKKKKKHIFRDFAIAANFAQSIQINFIAKHSPIRKKKIFNRLIPNKKNKIVQNILNMLANRYSIMEKVLDHIV